MWESLGSSGHFTPGLLIARLISDPSLQEGPKSIPPLLPSLGSGVIFKATDVPAALVKPHVEEQALSSKAGPRFCVGSLTLKGSMVAHRV